MASIAELLAQASLLPGEEAAREAEILLCHSLQRSRSYLYTWPEAEVDGAVQQVFEALMARRASGEPLAYITGERDFWSLTLTVDERTLIPRPDTETLVQWALELALPPAAAVADLGSGSGAIALALASEKPGWQIMATDISNEALAVLASNRTRLALDNVSSACGSWYEPLAAQRLDLIVSNPPYIEQDDPHLEQGDLRFEPRTALASGVDGLDDIRILVAQAPDYLRAGGWLLLEHGYEQAAAVRRLLDERGFGEVASRGDLAGVERVSGGRWLPPSEVIDDQ